MVESDIYINNHKLAFALHKNHKYIIKFHVEVTSFFFFYGEMPTLPSQLSILFLVLPLSINGRISQNFNLSHDIKETCQNVSK